MVTLGLRRIIQKSRIWPKKRVKGCGSTSPANLIDKFYADKTHLSDSTSLIAFKAY
jgi:hypothetical protein